MITRLLQFLNERWNRPSARDRILAVLLRAEQEGTPGGIPGMDICKLAAVGRGSVYSKLHRLEEEGLIKHTVGVPMAIRGGLPRYYYQLTDAGRGAAPVQPAEPVKA